MKLGDLVADKVTGIQGTITGYAKYLYGEDECLVSYVDNNGTLAISWFPAQRLELAKGE